MNEKNQAWTAEPLLPCPFCGDEANAACIDLPDGYGNEGGYVAECNRCGASSPVVFPDKVSWQKAVADVWNRRQEHLSGIDDPGEWRRLFDRLRKVSRQYRDESAWSFSATGELHDVIDDILALQPPTEEETSDAR